MGVEVERSLIFLTGSGALIFKFTAFKGRFSHKKAAAYLNNMVGGHGWESIGNTVRYAQRGYDGVIHILPVPRKLWHRASCRQSVRARHPGAFLSLDEQSGGPVEPALRPFLICCSSAGKGAQQV